MATNKLARDHRLFEKCFRLTLSSATGSSECSGQSQLSRREYAGCDRVPSLRLGFQKKLFLRRPSIQFLQLPALAGAGEVSEAGDCGQGQALHSEEAGFRFVTKAEHVRKAGDHAAQAKVDGAMGFIADFLHHAAGIVGAESCDGFCRAAYEGAYRRALVPSPEKRRHAKE